MSPTRRPTAALVLLCAAQYMLILDVAVVNVALPSIGRDLDFAAANLQWVITANLVAFGGFLLLGGRAADLLGRRRVLVAGLVVFAAGSLAGALSPTSTALVAARVVQGLGAALAVPAALALISAIYPDGRERRRALGAIGLASAAGSTSGVLLGGALTDLLSWQWVLVVNVPIALGAAVAAPFVLPESRDDQAGRGFDAAGAILVAGGLVAVVLAVAGVDRDGLLSARTLALGLIGLTLLAAFVIHERRATSPLVPFTIFQSRDLTASNLVAVAYSVGPFSFFLLGAMYLQGVLHYSPLQTGVAMLPFTFTAALMSMTVVGRVVGRVGIKAAAVGGMLMMASALVQMAFVSRDGAYVTDILPAAVLLGLGIQFAFVAVNIGALKDVDVHLFGLASGLLNTSLQMGAALGLAVVATLATSRSDPVAGLHLGALAGAAILLAGAGAALLAPGTKDAARSKTTTRRSTAMGLRARRARG